MTCCGKISYHKQYPYGLNGVNRLALKDVSLYSFFTTYYYFIPIFIFSLISSVRYRVGVDSEGYRRYFYDFLYFGETDEGAVEWGFAVIAKFTTILTESHYLLFFILSFLQIFFLYYALRKQTNALVYLGLSIMLSGTYLSLMNGVRQNIVACAFVAMIPLVVKVSKWWLYALCVLIASQMHASAFALLPLGLIAYMLKTNILNIKWQLIIISICFILMDKIPIESLTNFISLGAHAGYDERAIEAYTNIEMTSKSFGLYSFLLLFVYIICIIYSSKIQAVFNSENFNIYYNLFFIGVCLFLLFYNNFTVGRLIYYLRIFDPIIISMLLYVLKYTKGKFNKLIFSLTIFLMSVNIIYLFNVSSNNSLEFTLFKFDF